VVVGASPTRAVGEEFYGLRTPNQSSLMAKAMTAWRVELSKRGPTFSPHVMLVFCMAHDIEPTTMVSAARVSNRKPLSALLQYFVEQLVTSLATDGPRFSSTRTPSSPGRLGPTSDNPKTRVADLQGAVLETCMSNDDTLASTLWTVREAAEYLRCSRSYVYKAAERDLLPTVRIGRMVRFSPEAVRAFALAGSDVKA